MSHDAISDVILAALHSALASSGPMLGATEAQYVPYPATWLNQGRWQDEPTPTKPEPPAAPSTWDRVPLVT